MTDLSSTEYLARLAKAITPGPWRVGPVDDTRVEDADGNEVAQIDGDYNQPETWHLMEANAEAIALLPALIREVLDRREADRADERAEKAEAERDVALKEQDRLVKAWEAKHDYQVKQSKDHADYFDKSQRRMHELVAERDEARAQVATAYASGWKDGNHPDADQMPTNAKAALEAYGREKMREGMQRAYELSGQYHQVTHIRAAILAEMETLK